MSKNVFPETHSIKGSIDDNLNSTPKHIYTVPAEIYAEIKVQRLEGNAENIQLQMGSREYVLGVHADGTSAGHWNPKGKQVKLDPEHTFRLLEGESIEIEVEYFPSQGARKVEYFLTIEEKRASLFASGAGGSGSANKP